MNSVGWLPGQLQEVQLFAWNTEYDKVQNYLFENVLITQLPFQGRKHIIIPVSTSSFNGAYKASEVCKWGGGASRVLVFLRDCWTSCCSGWSGWRDCGCPTSKAWKSTQGKVLEPYRWLHLVEEGLQQHQCYTNVDILNWIHNYQVINRKEYAILISGIQNLDWKLSSTRTFPHSLFHLWSLAQLWLTC